jgi:transposase
MRDGAYSTIEMRRSAVEAAVRGVPLVQVAECYHVDRITVYRWVKRFEECGEHGLQRREGSGRPRKLNELTETELRGIVLQPASRFGFETDLWTVGRLRRVIREEFFVVLSKNTVWRRLRDAGLTWQKPERKYFEIDERARRQWLRTEVPKIRKTVRDFRAILYFQDESNVSLTAFLGKTWAPRGQTPRMRVTGARGGVAAMSALSRRGQLVFRLHDKRIASAEVIDFLRQMLQHHPRRHLVVLMDQAPPHVSKATTHYIHTQPRLHVYYLPKYSPDWNPDEKVWNHLKHHELQAHQAKTKQELHTLTHRKLQRMANDSHLLRGLFFRCCVADLFE